MNCSIVIYKNNIPVSIKIENLDHDFLIIKIREDTYKVAKKDLEKVLCFFK